MDKKFRVLHFLPYFPPHAGGVEMYAKEWAENFIKEGQECSIVTFSGGQKMGSRFEDGYKIIVLPAFDIVHSFPFPMIWLPSFWKGVRQIKKWNPDIVHTHTRFFLSSFLGGLFARWYHISWVHIEHGSGFVVSGNKVVEYASRWYDQTLGRWTLSHADWVVTVSKACEIFVRETFSVQKTSTIYRGMDRILSDKKPSKKEIDIGYVGRLVDLKGVHILIEAFSIFQKQYRGTIPVKLKIVGDGPERKNLEAFVKIHQLDDQVTFLGQRSIHEVRSDILPSFHIFVNPSFQEGFPTAVIEALIAGCHVVATDVGGTKEIREKVPFLLIDPRSVGSLVSAMENTISHLDIEKDPIKPLSVFSWKETFIEFQKVYMKVSR